MKPVRLATQRVIVAAPKPLCFEVVAAAGEVVEKRSEDQWVVRFEFDRGAGSAGSQDRGAGSAGSQDRGAGSAGSQDRGAGSAGSQDRGAGSAGSQDRGAGSAGSQDRGAGSAGSQDDDGQNTIVTRELLTLHRHDAIDYRWLEGPLPLVEERISFQALDERRTAMVYEGHFAAGRGLWKWLVGRFAIKGRFDRLALEHLEEGKAVAEQRAARTRLYE